MDRYYLLCVLFALSLQSVFGDNACNHAVAAAQDACRSVTGKDPLTEECWDLKVFNTNNDGTSAIGTAICTDLSYKVFKCERCTDKKQAQEIRNNVPQPNQALMDKAKAELRNRIIDALYDFLNKNTACSTGYSGTKENFLYAPNSRYRECRYDKVYVQCSNDKWILVEQPDGKPAIVTAAGNNPSCPS